MFRKKFRLQLIRKCMRNTFKNGIDIQSGYGLGVGVFHTAYGKAFFKEGHDDGWGRYTF